MIYQLQQEELIDDDDELAQHHESADLGIFPTLQDRRLLLTTLKLMGAKQIQVEFQGGGDSGEIHSLWGVDASGNNIDLDVEYPHAWQKKSEFNDAEKRWIDSYERAPRKLSDVLETLTYDALDKCGHDWYNNDGGQGSLTIDFSVSPPAVNMELGVNYTTTDEYTYEL